MQVDLSGRIAVVTGAAGGIGAAVCHRLGESGARVLAADICGERLDLVAAELGREGVHVETLVGDVADEAAVEGLFRQVVDRYGGVHVLVNNAGLSVSCAALKGLSSADWDRVVDANLRSVFLCSRAALQPMIRQRFGRIVNISSVTSMGDMDPAITELSYVAAKGGINSFTRGLARQVGPRGITVNAILPGLIRTPMTEPLLSGDLGEIVIENWLQRCPRRRVGRPDDVAALAVFLASDAADFITSQLICVDGGFL